MKRFAITVGIALVLGAIINLSLAVALAALPQPYPNGDFFQSQSSDPSWYFALADQGFRVVVASAPHPFADVGWTHAPQHVPNWSIVASPPPAAVRSDRLITYEFAAGWPSLAFKSRATVAREPPYAVDAQWALVVNAAPGLSPTTRFLPFKPIPVGFLLNTVVFAAPILILLAIPPTRRFLRRCRGLCPYCAYPLGPTPTCPECGYLSGAA